jgi:hypothetical protein
MARDRMQPDLEADDDLIPVTRESSRGGNEPPPDVNDRPEQNVAYDEVVRGTRPRKKRKPALRVRRRVPQHRQSGPSRMRHVPCSVDQPWGR